MTQKERTALIVFCGRFVMSLVLLGFAAWLITRENGSESKPALLIIGAVTGYWLK